MRNSIQSRLNHLFEDEQYYCMQPMFQKHPPNQIISAKYASDIVPQVKLITRFNQKKANITFVPPKVKNIELEQYGATFSFGEYLGLEYSKKMGQVVFMKFINAKHNIVMENKLHRRAMSAFYVPFEHFNIASIKNCEYFTKCLDINYPEYYNNPLQTFSKDSNKGCSFDPIFSSSYQSANLFAAFRKSPFEYDLILQNDTNSCGDVNWFNFAVQFEYEGYYNFNIVNMTANLTDMFQKGAKIAYCHLNSWSLKQQKRAGEGWNFGCQNIRYEESKIQRQMKPFSYYYNLHFEYRCKNKHDVTMFALNVPYSNLQNEKFFNRILDKKIRGMIRIQKVQIGRTIAGSPIKVYLIAKRKGRSDYLRTAPLQTYKQNNSKNRSINLSPISHSFKSIFASNYDTREKSMFFISRQQASDTQCSFTMEGMVEYLMNSIEFESLKKNYKFYFVPTLNVDGIRYGHDKCNLTGSQLQKNWKNPHRQHQAEIYWLKQFMVQVNKQFSISLIMDLVSNRNDVSSSFISVLNDNYFQCEDNRIFPYVYSKRDKTVSFEKSQFLRKNQNNSICCVLSDLFPKSSCYQLRISFFKENKIVSENDFTEQLSKLNGLIQMSSDQYRNFGKELISTYLEHIKLYEKNTLLKDKWLKQMEQIKLNQIYEKRQEYTDEKKTEERFQPSFTYIQKVYQSGAKLLTNDNVLKVDKNKVNYQQIKSNVSKTKVLRRRQQKKKSLPILIQSTFNEYFVKKNEIESELRSNNEILTINEELQQDLIVEDNQQQISSLFRVGQKKTSVLRNCHPNMFNFELQIQSRKQNKIKLGNPSKQLLKKQLSKKKLKKARIYEDIKSKKLNERSSLGISEFLKV